MNVIRVWLGHVSLDTTHRYAEITLRTKQAAVAACLPPVGTSETFRPSDGWRKDQGFNEMVLLTVMIMWPRKHGLR